LINKIKELKIPVQVPLLVVEEMQEEEDDNNGLTNSNKMM
jgi:hypothetical protein